MRWPLALVAIVTTTARATPDDADRAAAQAEERARGGDFTGAVRKFREAYAADPRAEFLCNVGVAYYKAKDLPRAQLYLSECLVRGTQLDASFVKSVRAVLQAVEDKLRAQEFTPVYVVVEPPGAVVSASAFDTDDTFVGTRVVWVPFGTLTLTVRADGFTTKAQQVEARSREPVSTRIRLVRIPDKPPIVVVHKDPSRIPAIVATSATGVAAIASTWLYLVARSDASKLGDPQLTYDQYRGGVKTATDRQHASWITGGIAGAGAIVSAYLWYRSTRSTRVDVRATGSGGSITLGRAF